MNRLKKIISIGARWKIETRLASKGIEPVIREKDYGNLLNTIQNIDPRDIKRLLNNPDALGIIKALFGEQLPPATINNIDDLKRILKHRVKFLRLLSARLGLKKLIPEEMARIARTLEWQLDNPKKLITINAYLSLFKINASIARKEVSMLKQIIKGYKETLSQEMVLSGQLRRVLDMPESSFVIPVANLLKIYPENIDWAVKRGEKSTAGTRGVEDIANMDEGAELNTAVVLILAQAYADYILNTPQAEKTVIIGYDERYFSKEFADLITRVMVANKIGVIRDKDGSSATPLVSFMVRFHRLALGLMITASHNPSDQNGIKPSMEEGMVATSDRTEKQYQELLRIYNAGKGQGMVKIAVLNDTKPEAGVVKEDFKQIYFDNYIQHIFSKEDIELIVKAMDEGVEFIFDGLYGVGGKTVTYYLKRLLKTYTWSKKIILMNETPDPNIGGIAKPDPSKPETLEYSGVIAKLIQTQKEKGKVLLAASADMDADRMGTAVIISKDERIEARTNGLLVGDKESVGKKVYFVRFTPDQVFTMIGYDRGLIYFRRRLMKKGSEPTPEKIKKLLAKDRTEKKTPLNLMEEEESGGAIIGPLVDGPADLHFFTTIPGSMFGPEVISRLLGAKCHITAVGFKNLGYETLLVEKGANIKEKNRAAKDKDTCVMFLAFMVLASRLFLEKRSIVDFYKEIAESLGKRLYYIRQDIYLPDEKTA
ncbi:hypothetical protein HQ584_06265, partial [Patescibacteria group bacterium]|nr:hypothetical protein [Patescibacteria group bacterium]